MAQTATVRSQNGASRRETLLSNIRHRPVLYLMALPVILYFLIFHFLPMFGVVIAFQRYVPAKGIFGSQWVGFKHFKAFFNDIYFWRLIRNTFLIQFYDTLFGYPIPIIFALLLNEVRQRRFKRVVQTVTYMPHFISMVVICGLVFSFTRTTGPLAQIVSRLSGRPVENLLARPDLFRPIYIISSVWQGFGWASIIYFAALSAVDPTLYEAAAIDGASRLRQVFAVTIPSIMPTIIIMYILRIGQIMSVGFEKIILLYSPLTYETADVISSYVYRRGVVELNFSYSTAVGLFNSVVNLAAIILANALSRRVSETSLW